jgi:hypothetical protein
MASGYYIAQIFSKENMMLIELKYLLYSLIIFKSLLYTRFSIEWYTESSEQNRHWQ